MFNRVHEHSPPDTGEIWLLSSSEKVCCFFQIFLSLILEVNDTFKLRHACKE